MTQTLETRCLKYKPLPLEEEKELIKEYKITQNPQLRETIIKHNLRLVYYLAKKSANTWKVPHLLEDLFQVGSVYLLRALKPYDPDKGARFGNYAYDWIHREIKRYILRNKKSVAYKTHELEIAVEHGFNNRGISLNEKINRSFKHSETRITQLPSEEQTEEDLITSIDNHTILNGIISKYITLDQSIPKTKQRCLKILAERLLSNTPRALEDLGKELGVSRERVRQLELTLMNKLKDYSQPYREPSTN